MPEARPSRADDPDPLGVVLAGGAGRRLGGEKAVVRLCGRPLVEYPVETLKRALGEVVVVAKADSRLPPLPLEVWVEAEESRHPAHGIAHALRRAEGRPVLVCAADLPLVSERLVRALAARERRGAAAVIAASGGELQPLLGVYAAAALPVLSAPANRALRDLAALLDPRVVDVADPAELLNVNRPEDLLLAAQALAGRG